VKGNCNATRRATLENKHASHVGEWTGWETAPEETAPAEIATATATAAATATATATAATQTQ
jgi:hypothetical protein